MTTMDAQVRKQVAKAVARVTVTLHDVAGWLHVSYGTVRAYGQGVRTAPPPALRRLAKALRRHAKQLTQTADRLDTLADRDDR